MGQLVHMFGAELHAIALYRTFVGSSKQFVTITHTSLLCVLHSIFWACN